MGRKRIKRPGDANAYGTINIKEIPLQLIRRWNAWLKIRGLTQREGMAYMVRRCIKETDMSAGVDKNEHAGDTR